MIDKVTNNGFFNRMHRLRKAMSTQMKVTILIAVGFTVVFGAVGSFIGRQFREVVYSNPIMRVKQPFDSNQANLLNSGENVISNSYLHGQKVFLPKENRVYIKYFNQSWYMFYKRGTMVSYQNIGVEHDMVERFSSRLLLIMGTSEVLLLLMAFILARTNMIPITRALKQQRRFVADAAHEFKTPMTVIQNKLETMLEHPNDSVMDQVENVANSLTEVRHLNKLTADMLKLAQADAEVTMFDFKPTDLVGIIKEVSEILEIQFKEKNQNLNFEMPEELIIDGDGQRLRQLILNLVDNAHKYTDENTTITIQLKKLRSTARIKIIDNGEGISTEDKKHLFDRFYRVDKSRSRASGGHGLGLSIVQWIVEGHGGKINVEDTIPHGTTFDIALPLRHKKQPDK